MHTCSLSTTLNDHFARSAMLMIPSSQHCRGTLRLLLTPQQLPKLATPTDPEQVRHP